jgi:hypothetical protein
LVCCQPSAEVVPYRQRPAHTSSPAQNAADPTPTPSTTFVANDGANSVTEYARGASGNATPAATISGNNTGLNNPFGLGFDSSRDLLVTNFALCFPALGAGVSCSRTIHVHASGMRNATARCRPGSFGQSTGC